jgi:multidrug resistance efflux pump
MGRSAVVPLIAVSLLGLALYHVARNSQAEPPLEPPVAPSRAPFSRTIAGTGIVEPCTENIAVGTHSAGVVEEVFIRVGDHVEQGKPLFRIDSRQLRADLAVREAMLASARAQLERLEQMPRTEELPGSAARLREAEARYGEEEDRYGRIARLMERKIISEEEFATRRQGLAVAREQLAKARADDDLLRAGAWGPDKDVARAAVKQSEAQVEQARIDLERLTVNAPLSGDVLKVNVRVGEYVAQPSSSELLILGSLAPLHVRAEIDEADIPRFRPGQPARGYVRGDPVHAIELRFVRTEPYVIPKKSLTGSNTERVDTRVLQAIYAVDATERPLYVGQQLDVFVELPEDAAE